jgi:hypothetical protein
MRIEPEIHFRGKSRILKKKLEKIICTPIIMKVTAGMTILKLSEYGMTPKLDPFQ